MVTQAQLEANKQNALKGGVKTDGGKNRSKYNAIQHGILLEAITEYEQGHYQDCLTELLDELKPVGFLETVVVERIAMCYLRLYRIAKVEWEFIYSQLHPFTVTKTDPSEEYRNRIVSSVEKVEVSGYQPKISADAVRQLDQTLLRYDTSVENKLYKALRELERLKAIRLGRPVPFPNSLDITVNHNQTE